MYPVEGRGGKLVEKGAGEPGFLEGKRAEGTKEEFEHVGGGKWLESLDI